MALICNIRSHLKREKLTSIKETFRSSSIVYIIGNQYKCDRGKLSKFLLITIYTIFVAPSQCTVTFIRPLCVDTGSIIETWLKLAFINI